MSVSNIRSEYGKHALHESEVDPNPFRQFRAWFEEATAAGIPDVNAMTLATATRDGRVSARIVLLKGFDERGFSFFTNYESRKGRELEENPNAALVFHWQPFERQIRIEGTVSRMTPAEADEYFDSRPFGSKVGAAASPQSRPVPSRAYLEERFAMIEHQHTDGSVPRPPHWGGFRVEPHALEFWQGRPSRLHDRLLYVRKEDGSWVIQRLAP